MKKAICIAVFVLVGLSISPAVWATNGDNLIGVGPVARAMGGVGIAKPLDAISAVFANPAAMCFGDYCPASELNFAGTLFAPKTEAKITNAFGTFSAEAKENVYAIPAIGVSVPIGEGPKNWRFGLSAYGVTGLGVDYKDTVVDNQSFYDFGPFGQFPLASGEFTSLQIMKFAPAVAFQPNSKMSFGLAVHIDYGILDLRSGNASGYGFGIQPGFIYNFTDQLSFGLTYVSPQEVDHEKVADFDGDGRLDDLTLESPQQLGLGLAYDFLGGQALIEGNVKWINWSNAKGYDDFDWKDQWVYAIGAQYQPTERLSIRVGYNYGKNPVEEHSGFNGALGPTGPLSVNNVQGKTVPSYYYETFRIIGFPAIVEHHITFGIGYQFTETFSLNLGFMHAFEKTIEESGTDLTGQPVKLESTLTENAIDFGFTWRF
ncbi:MAG: outer membrane protein transport protein [Desulfobacteraceae bacterium]|jgi:long-chain fatty acid transport protein|nr:outer membrane protein transport protein [Desulfobacteraceae bacterium]